MTRAALALLFFWIYPTFAQPAFTAGGDVQIRVVIDGMTLALSDGRQLRLVGIEVPARGASAERSKQILAELTANGTVALRFAGNPRDRQGRVLAQAFVGEIWLQGELLKRGLARVQSTADNRIGVAEMLALERQARRYHRGLWSERAYAIINAAEASRFAGTFQLVTGTVDHADTAANELFIAFGPDRHRDFTITLSPAAQKLCREAGLDPTALAGKTILVRGFIDGSAHPSIAVTHPEQIEILRQKKTAPKRSSGPP